MKLKIGDTCIVRYQNYLDSIGEVVFDFDDGVLYLICHGEVERRDRFLGREVSKGDDWYDAVSPNLYYSWERPNELMFGEIILPLAKILEQLEREVC